MITVQVFLKYLWIYFTLVMLPLGQYSSVSQHMLIIMIKFIVVPKSTMNWSICFQIEKKSKFELSFVTNKCIRRDHVCAFCILLMVLTIGGFNNIFKYRIHKKTEWILHTWALILIIKNYIQLSDRATKSYIYYITVIVVSVCFYCLLLNKI